MHAMHETGPNAISESFPLNKNVNCRIQALKKERKKKKTKKKIPAVRKSC